MGADRAESRSRPKLHLALGSLQDFLQDRRIRSLAEAYRAGGWEPVPNGHTATGIWSMDIGSIQREVQNWGLRFCTCNRGDMLPPCSIWVGWVKIWKVLQGREIWAKDGILCFNWRVRWMKDWSVTCLSSVSRTWTNGTVLLTVAVKTLLPMLSTSSILPAIRKRLRVLSPNWRGSTVVNLVITTGSQSLTSWNRPQAKTSNWISPFFSHYWNGWASLGMPDTTRTECWWR